MTTNKQLVDTIIKGIQEKKGQRISVIDLRNIDGAIAQYFVICQGGSPTQVEAIAESVGDTMRKDLGEKPTNVVGLGLSQWVAMDFVDVLVHIFLPETREFYDIENLWQDATITEIEDV
ncbi:MAG: ribosome silencing factor [Prevotella sp.]|nr:ribosome silencing factor [Prevotella sp.]